MTSTALSRTRCLYIGSAIPTVSKDGLHGIQQPLRERYCNNSPETKGIDSWLSVFANGILLEYIFDGKNSNESTFFPIQSLHYCAAVRYVNMVGFAIGGGERFLPLDEPFANVNLLENPHPPIFAAILRRSSGIKVLECHAFICLSSKAANSLVRSCFKIYADMIHSKMNTNFFGIVNPCGKMPIRNGQRTSSSRSSSEMNLSEHEFGQLRESELEKHGIIVDEDPASYEDRYLIENKQWQRQQNGEYDDLSLSSLSRHQKIRNESPKNVIGKNSPDKGSIAKNPNECGILIPYHVRGRPRHLRNRSASPQRFHGVRPPFVVATPPPEFLYPHFRAIFPSHSRMAEGRMNKNSQKFERAPPLFAWWLQPPPFATMLPHFCQSRMKTLPPKFLPPPIWPPPFVRTFFNDEGPPKYPNAQSGPIITDYYDTLPRHHPSQGAGPTTYEEPIYMSNLHFGMTSKPRAFTPPDYYEHYYETSWKRDTFDNLNKFDKEALSSRSNFYDATTGTLEKDIECNFENESKSKPSKAKCMPNDIPQSESHLKPETPPADYDVVDLVKSSSKQQITAQL